MRATPPATIIHVPALLPRWPAAAAGRFAGPLIVGGVTKIATPDGQTGYCTEWATGAGGAEDCVGPPDQQCVITGEQVLLRCSQAVHSGCTPTAA